MPNQLIHMDYKKHLSLLFGAFFTISMYIYIPARVNTILDFFYISCFCSIFWLIGKAQKEIFQFDSFLLCAYFLFGIYIYSINSENLPATFIPSFRNVMKLIFFIQSLLLIYLFRKAKLSFGEKYIAVGLFLVFPITGFYHLGVTLKAIPVLIYFLVFFPFVSKFKKGNLSRSLLSFLALNVSLFVLFFLSYDRYHSLTSLAYLLTLVFLFLIISTRQIDFRYRNGMKLISVFVFQSVIVLIILNILEILKGKSGFKTHIAGINPNSIGGFLALVGLPVLYFLKTKVKKSYFLAFCFLTIVLLFFSFSRTSMLVFAFGLAYIYFSEVRLKLSLYQVSSLFIFLIISLAFLFYAIFSLDKFNFMSFFHRVEIWNLFIKETTYFAFLFGFGLDAPFMHIFLPVFEDGSPLTYIDFIHKFGPNLHAHNLFLQIYFNFGVTGLATVILVLLFLFYKNFKNKFFIIVFFPFLFFSLFEFTSADIYTGILLILTAAISIRNGTRKSYWSPLMSSILEKTNEFHLIAVILFFSLFSLSIATTQKNAFVFKDRLSVDNFGFYYKKNIPEVSNKKLENWTSDYLNFRFLHIFNERKYQLDSVIQKINNDDPLIRIETLNQCLSVSKLAYPCFFDLVALNNVGTKYEFDATGYLLSEWKKYQY